MSHLRAYIQVTKPTIVFLVAVTGFTTMMAEGSLFQQPGPMLLALMLIVMAAGSANAFNQFIDRDIDVLMERTRKRRPLPQQHLSAMSVLIFALITAVISTAGLWIFFNALSAMLSLGTILFYVGVYTLWLKRRHPYNIVIGGIAGSTAPLIASAAATNSLSWISWLGFSVIFMWTPPHFWALALAIKDDYAKVKIPMLPNVYGDRRTKWEIYSYTILLLPLTVPTLYKLEFHPVLVGTAFLLWLWYFVETLRQLPKSTKAAYYKLFYVSIFYLLLYFTVLAVEGMLRYGGNLFV